MKRILDDYSIHQNTAVQQWLINLLYMIRENLHNFGGWEWRLHFADWTTAVPSLGKGMFYRCKSNQVRYNCIFHDWFIVLLPRVKFPIPPMEDPGEMTYLYILRLMELLWYDRTFSLIKLWHKSHFVGHEFHIQWICLFFFTLILSMMTYYILK